MRHHEFKYMRLVFAVGPLVVLLLVAVFLAEIEPRELIAGSGDNMGGWAWSSNIGWVSFNCTNNPPGDSCASSDFGVNLNTISNEVEGEAWSDNVGWLNFDAPNPGGRPSATFVPASGELRGWARFLSNGGGWDGWLSLNAENCDADGDGLSDGSPVGCPVAGTPLADYNVRLSACTNLEGFAWGGDVVGWLNFDQVNLVGGLDLPPAPPGLVTVTDPDYCGASPQPRFTFNWDYVDPCGGDPQSGVKIQILDHLGNLVFDSCTTDPRYDTCSGHSSQSWAPLYGIKQLEYDRTIAGGNPYRVQVQVFDSAGNSSGFSAPVEFEVIPVHAYPSVGFDYTPSRPFIDEPVTFDSTIDDNGDGIPDTHCYLPGGDGKTVDLGGCPLGGYVWNFDGGVDTGAGTIQTPIAKFSTRDTYAVTLNVTDNEGYTCSDLQNVDIDVKFKIPDWREIAP